MSEPPTEIGYDCTICTTALLQSGIEEALDATVRHDTVRGTLHKLDHRGRRPRWDVELEDRRNTEIKASMARAIGNAGPGTFCLLENETSFRTVPPLRRMSMKTGQRVRVHTTEQDGKLYRYGAPDLESGNWIDSLFDKANFDATTVSYLEDVLVAYPARPIPLIWDQAGYHMSRRVRKRIDQHPQLTVPFLANHALELNPAERIWPVVKE